MKVKKAMLGRGEDSRIANWIPSKTQPLAVHSLRTDSMASSVTVEISITLYSVGTVLRGVRG